MKATKVTCGCCGDVVRSLTLDVCEACYKHMRDDKWTDAHIHHYFGARE